MLIEAASVRRAFLLGMKTKICRSLRRLIEILFLAGLAVYGSAAQSALPDPGFEVRVMATDETEFGIEDMYLAALDYDWPNMGRDCEEGKGRFRCATSLGRIPAHSTRYDKEGLYLARLNAPTRSAQPDSVVRMTWEIERERGGKFLLQDMTALIAAPPLLNQASVLAIRFLPLDQLEIQWLGMLADNAPSGAVRPQLTPPMIIQGNLAPQPVAMFALNTSGNALENISISVTKPEHGPADPTEESTIGFTYWARAVWKYLPQGTASLPAVAPFEEVCGRHYCATAVVPGDGSKGMQTKVAWSVRASAPGAQARCYEAVVAVPPWIFVAARQVSHPGSPTEIDEWVPDGARVGASLWVRLLPNNKISVDILAGSATAQQVSATVPRLTVSGTVQAQCPVVSQKRGSD